MGGEDIQVRSSWVIAFKSAKLRVGGEQKKEVFQNFHVWKMKEDLSKEIWHLGTKTC